MKIFKRENRAKFMLYITGFIALLWFLIRVIPKPSRAAYPCQRAAFPIASTFVIWLIGAIGTYLSYKKAKKYFRESKYSLAVSFLILASIIFMITQFNTSFEEALANPEEIIMNDLLSDSTMVNPQAVVSIVRSNKERAEDIDSLEIYDLVRQAVELAGGFDDLIHDNSVVVLKPNLLTAWVMNDNWEPAMKIDEKVNSVTTDYRVIQAVVNLVREKNPNGKVYIIEGSGVGKTRSNMINMGWFKITGVDDFLCLEEESACGGWRDTTSKELVKISLPSGKALCTSAKNRYYLNRIYYEADVLISIPVLKTHSHTCVTGAVKNVGIGATPVTIYGGYTDSGRERIDHGSASSYMSLHNWIHDFYMCRPVDFAVMDALTGMQNGPCPVTRDPVSRQKKNTRCIIASKDPIAMDAIESLIIQMDPSKVRHLVALHNDSLGCVDPKYIRVRGMRVDQVKDKYANTVAYARYSDFTPPKVSVDSYEITGDSLYIDLNADEQVVKVEIAVDDYYLAPIYTGNFDNITVNLGETDIDPRRIKIYTYDKYLNCAEINLQTTGVKTGNKPESFLLMQNYPNPFNPTTNLGFQISECGLVVLKVFDVLGNEVATLVNEEKQPGYYQVEFNRGNLASGVYIYKLTAGKHTAAKKLILLK